MADKFKIRFYGGVGEVTGANFLLERTGENPLKILFDCGLHQGDRYSDLKNYEPFQYDPASIDYLFITHAHMDHIGRVPKLARDGFKGVIYSTPETKEISAIMYEDALKIMSHETQGRKQSPLYELEDVNRALSLWNTLTYHKKLDLPWGISVTPKDAGHILGSAMFEVSVNNKKIVFTGDLGNTPAPLLCDTEPLIDATYLVMESVYGDRNHEEKGERLDKFVSAIQGVVSKKGVLIIPAFSLERTQVILYELNNLVEDGKVPSIPVFLDSPLAIKVTEIYKKMRKDFKPEVQAEIQSGDDIFNFPKLRVTRTVAESHHIEMTPNPKIIIAGGGMSEGGRVMGHEQKYLPDSRNTIVLVGHQSAGTLGRALLEGAKSVEINGKEVEIRAEIRNINGYSAHKDSDNLLEFVADSAETLRKVFVVMGEPKASMFLAQRIRDSLGLEAIYPEVGETYEIDV